MKKMCAFTIGLIGFLVCQYAFAYKLDPAHPSDTGVYYWVKCNDGRNGMVNYNAKLQEYFSTKHGVFKPYSTVDQAARAECGE